MGSAWHAWLAAQGAGIRSERSACDIAGGHPARVAWRRCRAFPSRLRGSLHGRRVRHGRRHALLACGGLLLSSGDDRAWA